jgi:hypothetical protein
VHNALFSSKFAITLAFFRFKYVTIFWSKQVITATENVVSVSLQVWVKILSELKYPADGVFKFIRIKKGA